MLNKNDKGEVNEVVKTRQNQEAPSFPRRRESSACLIDLMGSRLRGNDNCYTWE